MEEMPWKHRGKSWKPILKWFVCLTWKWSVCLTWKERDLLTKEFAWSLLWHPGHLMVYSLQMNLSVLKGYLTILWQYLSNTKKKKQQVQMSSVLHSVWRPRVQRKQFTPGVRNAYSCAQNCVLKCLPLSGADGAECCVIKLCVLQHCQVYGFDLHVGEQRMAGLCSPGRNLPVKWSGGQWALSAWKGTNIHSQAGSRRAENVGDISSCCTQILSYCYSAVILLLTSSWQSKVFLFFFFLTNIYMENRNFFERLPGWVLWLNKSRSSTFISVIMQELLFLCTNGISQL